MQEIKKEPKCQRQGYCCMNCRFLVRLPNNKTLCRIYRNRLGTRINENQICVMRIEQRDENGKILKFPNCEYNEVK